MTLLVTDKIIKTWLGVLNFNLITIACIRNRAPLRIGFRVCIWIIILFEIDKIKKKNYAHLNDALGRVY